MKIAHSMQGIYSPLPQSLSDSESEKEISMEPICTSYNSKNPSGFETSLRQNGHSMKIEDCNVNVKRGASKMSIGRKVAFVCSIILCLLPIVIFLRVLPCSELHTCPIKTTEWQMQEEGVEFKGPIHLVRGLYRPNYNLAVLYRGSLNSQKVLKNGILSFMGLTGNVAWDVQQEVEPFKMNCSIIDTDGNGQFECLVIDIKGLKAIETISGQVLWHCHSSEEKKTVRNLSLPVTIVDLNNDGIKELLSIFEMASFLVISGKSGRALANIRVPHCGKITDIYLSDTTKKKISYVCTNITEGNGSDGMAKNYEVDVSEVEKSFANPQYMINVTKVETGSEHKVYVVDNRKLTINNGPNCPKCHCVLTLYDKNDAVLKTWAYNNAFIMNPKVFTFQASKSRKLLLKGHTSGFIVKIWQWSEHYRKLRPSQKVNKRSASSFPNMNETYFSTEVSERVMLITFNDTDIHVINASFTEINQICDKEERHCQPDHENQKDSILVADLDEDGNQELIGFYSTYLKREEDWYLVSYLKVLRLEEELPKLYGSK